MAGEVTGIRGIPRRLVKARRLLSADRDRDKPVTQRQIAAAVGVTEGQIGHWEKGRQYPDVLMLEKLAAALEVEIQWLILGTGPMAAATLNVAGLAVDPADVERITETRLDVADERRAAVEAQTAAPQPTRQAGNSAKGRRKQ